MVIFWRCMIMSQIEGRFRCLWLADKRSVREIVRQGCSIGLVEVSALSWFDRRLWRIFPWRIGSTRHGVAPLGMLGRSSLLLWACLRILVSGITQYTSGIASVLASCLCFHARLGRFILGNPGEGRWERLALSRLDSFSAFALRRTAISGWLWDGTRVLLSEKHSFTPCRNSGLVLEGHLSNATLHGARWLTGGTQGRRVAFSVCYHGDYGMAIHFLFFGKETRLPKIRGRVQSVASSEAGTRQTLASCLR